MRSSCPERPHEPSASGASGVLKPDSDPDAGGRDHVDRTPRTGAVLELGLPFFLNVLHLSLNSAQSYERLTRIAGTGLFKVALVAFIWALSHHLLAGVRHLLMDVGIGSHLADARRSAWSVNIGGAVMALVAVGVVL